MFARYEDAEKALAATQGSLHQKEKKMEQIEIFITEVEALPDCITEFRTDYWWAPGREGHGASEGSDDLRPFLRGGD